MKEVTRYFLDTEFIENGYTIDLISIGIACEDGRTLYLCNRNAELRRASDWVRANVLPSLPDFDSPIWQPRSVITEKVMTFVRPTPKPQFWAYYAAYDWVALCQLFGTMMALPKHFPRYCMDLKQLSVMRGSPRNPPPPVGEHNALVDALWDLELFEFLGGADWEGQ